ncbi:unnamed protein product, partial [Prorocentrum cordatum]
MRIISTDNYESDGTGTLLVSGFPDSKDPGPKEVKVDRVALSDESSNLRTRFHPPLDGECVSDINASRLKGLAGKVLKQTKIVLSEEKEAEVDKVIVEDPAEALKQLESKFDDMAMLLKCPHGNPKTILDRFRKELTELLTKPGFKTTCYHVLDMAYEEQMNESKPILKERKKLLNEWCKVMLLAQQENTAWLFEEEKEEEEEEEKEGNKEGSENTPETDKPPGEEKDDASPEAGVELPDVKERNVALKLLKDNPDSSHIRLCANVGVFCEELSSLQVSSEVKQETRTLFHELTELKNEHEMLIPEHMKKVIADLMQDAQPKSTSKATPDGDEGLDSEMCQEQEQEQEQQIEQGPDTEPDNRKFADMGDTLQWKASSLLNGQDRKKLFSDRTSCPPTTGAKPVATFHNMKDFTPQGGKISGKSICPLKIDTNLYISPNYAEKELKQDAAAGELKRRLPNASVLLYVKNGREGCWAILSLLEAETLRAWMLGAGAQGDAAAASMGLVTSSGTWLTQPVGEKELIVSPEVRDPLSEGRAPLSAAAPLVFTRAFNWEVYYDEQELVTLITVMRPTPDEGDRARWFQAVRDGRRRDRKEAKQTVLEQAIKTEDPKKLEIIRKGMKVIRLHVEKFPDSEAAFKELDADGNGSLDRQEFKQAFSDSGLDQAELSKIFSHFDANGDRQLNLREFLRALSMKEMSPKERVRRQMAEHGAATSSGARRAAVAERDDSSATAIKLLGHKVVARKAQRGLGALAAVSEECVAGEFQVVCGASACFIGSRVISCAVGGVVSVAPSGIQLRQKDRMAAFFEVTLMEGPPGSACSVGIATPKFAVEEKVQRIGDDQHSFGVCGFGRTPAKLQNGSSEIFDAPPWSPGTVLGVLVDLSNDQKTVLRYFVNGVELREAEFSSIDLGGEEYVCPVFTVEFGAKLYVNWGDQTLRYRPPTLDQQVLTVHQVISLEKDAQVREKDGKENTGKMRIAEARNNPDYWAHLQKFHVEEESEGNIAVRVELAYSWLPVYPEPFFLHGMLLTTGKWYYEVEVTALTSRFFKLTAGFADPRCDGKPESCYSHFSVGSTEGGWGLDVADTELAGDGEEASFLHMEGNDYEGQKGDVYGFEANLEEGSITVHYRGVSDPPPRLGTAFVKVPFQGGLRPMVGVGRGLAEVKIRLDPPARHVPEGARPVMDYVRLARQDPLRSPGSTVSPCRARRRGRLRGAARPAGGAPDEVMRIPVGREYAWLEGPGAPLVGFEPRPAAQEPEPEDEQGVGPEGAGEADEPARRVRIAEPEPQAAGSSEAPAPSAPLVSHKGFNVVALKHRPVVRGTRPCFSGNFYYEVKICRIFARTPSELAQMLYFQRDLDEQEVAKRGGPASIGWSTPTFSGDHLMKGVGDDRFSWGYEGSNPKMPGYGVIKFNGKRFGPRPENPLPKWEERCVIGVACSITESKAVMRWTLDGKLLNEAEEEVDLSVYAEPGLVPAISMHDGLQVQVNLGPNFWCGKKAGSSLVIPWENCGQLYKPVSAIKADDTIGMMTPPSRGLHAKGLTNPHVPDDEDQKGRADLDVDALPTLRPSVEQIILWAGREEKAWGSQTFAEHRENGK